MVCFVPDGFSHTNVSPGTKGDDKSAQLCTAFGVKGTPPSQSSARMCGIKVAGEVQLQYSLSTFFLSWLAAEHYLGQRI